MIISRVPLRITLGGGGTDLRSYFALKGGYVISLAIRKYITIIINENLKKNYEIKYSLYENVKKINDIKHNIIRECLKRLKIKKFLEIGCYSDVPYGTGLGSSGAFTVCLLSALYKFKKKKILKKKKIEEAYKIEKIILKQPVGYQDQAIATYGGVLEQIYKKNKILYKKIKISPNLKNKIKKNFFLIGTNSNRNSKVILKTQEKLLKKKSINMISNLDYVKKLGLKTKKSILNNLQGYDKIMNEHWLYKLKREGMTIDNNTKILINHIKNKVLSLKLVGAGGSGYVLAYTSRSNQLKKILIRKKYIFFNVDIDNHGLKIINSTL